MSYIAHTARYLENDVLTRSPEWLVPLLYEHLLMSLRRARIQIEANDVGGRTASLDRASAILGELLASLDREKGGELAGRLASLYAYFAVELLNVGRSNGLGSLPKVIDMVEELHIAWTQAAERVAPRTPRGSLDASAA